MLLLLQSACVQILTHAGQEIPRMCQKSVDVVSGERELSAMVRGLPIEEGVVQPTRELLRQQGGLDVELIEQRDGATVRGRLGVADAKSARRRTTGRKRGSPRSDGGHW